MCSLSASTVFLKTILRFQLTRWSFPVITPRWVGWTQVHIPRFYRQLQENFQFFHSLLSAVLQLNFIQILFFHHLFYNLWSVFIMKKVKKSWFSFFDLEEFPICGIWSSQWLEIFIYDLFTHENFPKLNKYFFHFPISQPCHTEKEGQSAYFP